MLIGVISDTHGVLRDEVVRRLNGCDAILHAGDVCDGDILDRLSDTAPLYAVRGNNDWALAKRLRPQLKFELGGLRFFMTHQPEHIPASLSDVDIIVFGHTHRYYEKTVNGVLRLNPGSCGRRSFGGELSYALLHIDAEKHFFVEKVDLTV